MVVINVSTNCTPQTIVIGRRATYDTLQVVFDLSVLAETYGSGAAVLVVKRSQDKTAYPATIEQDGNTLTWTISETDTYYVGAGECELMWYVNNGLAKTIIYPVVVMRDILQTAEEPPDAYENWVEHLTALGAETQQNALNAAQSATDAETAKDDAVTAKEAAAAILEEFTTPTASATTLPAGSQATATYSDGNFAFGIPRGADGDPGDPGVTPDFSIGTVTTLEPTEPATATITGTAEAPVLNLGIPKGEQGDPGQGGGSVDSVNGQTGDVVLDAGDIEFDDQETYASGSVGAELSSQKNAIDTKAPVIINTASGDIVTFADGADGMPIKHLVANIEPVQSGTGDPSPENIRPISGWTGLTGQACGKNLLPNKKYQDTEIRVRLGVDNGTDIGFFKAGTYKFSIDSSVAVTPYFRQIEGGTNGEVHQIVNGNVVIPTDGHYRFWVFAESISVSDINWFQLELGSTATDYEEYQGQTISVSWATEAGTVYGGTLDVVTGELTVTKAYALLNNPDLWAELPSTSTTPFQYQYNFNGRKLYNDSYTGLICSYYKINSSDPTNTARWSGVSNIKFGIKSPTLTLDQIKADASAGKIAICYDLATPQIYQLDPVTVNTLLGNNTVYVDCGSVTVDYPADTGIVVAEQSNAIDQKADKTTYVTLSGTQVTQVGADNTMYLCGELAELTFTAPATGITAIRFTSGTTPTTYTFNGIKMPDDFPVTTEGATSISGTLDASTTYEINVLNGLGVWQSWI